jgi:hypothetical protein
MWDNVPKGDTLSIKLAVRLRSAGQKIVPVGHVESDPRALPVSTLRSSQIRTLTGAAIDNELIQTAIVPG